MKRIRVRVLRRLAFIGAFASVLFCLPAKAQVVVFPPDAWVATTPPVYFEGRAAYWYGGRWYYREGNGWGYYHDEPGFLRKYRAHHEPVRRFYEGRSGARGGGVHRR